MSVATFIMCKFIISRRPQCISSLFIVTGFMLFESNVQIELIWTSMLEELSMFSFVKSHSSCAESTFYLEWEWESKVLLLIITPRKKKNIFIDNLLQNLHSTWKTVLFWLNLNVRTRKSWFSRSTVLRSFKTEFQGSMSSSLRCLE